MFDPPTQVHCANAVQLTCKLVTLLVIVPLPLLIEQVNPVGCVETATAYAVPEVNVEPKLKLVAPELIASMVVLLLSTKPLAVKPLIEPPTL